MAFAEYENYDALGLAELVASGDVTSTELVEEAISRIDSLNPALNAVIHRMDEYARERAARPRPGPFAGVPFLLKDLLASLAGQPMNNGSRMYLGYVPDHNSTLVDRFLDSGVVVVGKTNTPELGLLPTTEPTLYGPTHNPWATGHSAGGSSGGSAAAVAAGIVPMASCGDGGGSIRIPASCCGIFGIKPSRGRNPQGPDETNLWGGGVCEHVLSRSVRDSAAMLDAVSGADPGAPYMLPRPSVSFLKSAGKDPRRLRIAVTTQPYLADDVHPDCVKAIEEAVVLLEELGHEIVEDRSDVDGEAFGLNFLMLLAAEVYASFRDAERDMGRRVRGNDFEEQSAVLEAMAQTFTAGELAWRMRELNRMGRQIAKFVEGYDAVLNPTLCTPPPKHGFLNPQPGDRIAQKFLRHGRALGVGKLFQLAGGPAKAAKGAYAFAGYSMLFNISGNPSMSVPLHWNDSGLPIGVMFSSRLGDDATLLSLAGQLERARPWWDKRPPRA